MKIFLKIILAVALWNNPAAANKNLIEEYNGFKIYDIQEEDGLQSIEIYKNGLVVKKIEGFRLSPHFYKKEDNFLGNNKAILLVHDWTGGAHCCNNYYFIEFDEGVKKLPTLYAADHDLEFIADNSGAHVMVKMRDTTFNYFYASFAESLAPEVTLKFNGEKFIFDIPSMKKNVTETEFQQRVTHLKQKLNKTPKFITFIEEAVDLIYSGNAKYAFDLIDKLFANYKFNELNAAEFKIGLLCRIKKSPHAVYLAEMNAPFLVLPNNCEKEKNNPFSFY